jgi:uncharacterized protein (DUF885 family)
MVSCQKSKGVNDYVDIYQSLQDSLSEKQKNDWGLENDSIGAIKKIRFTAIAEGLKMLNDSALATNDLINKELLILELENELNEIEFGSHMLPLNSEGGFLAGIVYNIQYSSAKNKEEQEKYIQKLKSLPEYLQKQQQVMTEGITKSITSPDVITLRCMNLMQPHLNAAGDDNIFLAPCDDNDSLKSIVKLIVEKDILPAYRSFYQFLKEDYLPASKTTPGISALAGGKLYYENKIKYYTTLDMTPLEVYQKGLTEVERIKKEMQEVKQQAGFKGSFESFIAFLRTDPQFYAKTPRELLYRASWLAKKMEGKLPQYFNLLPRMPFTVEEVPAAIAPNYTGGRYSEGSYETGKPGAYWVNTYKLESRPLYILPSLTLHEAVPGHHLQIMLSRELKNVPKFRENLYISAFGEGWGLYSEYLGIEAGMYETPYENFGRLTYEMWRACRLVIDVGLHCKGWSRQQAVDFMASHTALSIHEVNTEIDRYIGWPGQAVSYKIGELKIRELRKEAETALGDKFDIKAFHDLVLSNGFIKLSTLDRIVRQWISEKKTSERKNK